MKRRDALKAMGGLAGAATLGKVLPGCGSGDDGPKGITTYVFMMMENRSYDHAMGARSMLEGLDGDGLTSDMSNLGRDGVTPHPVFEVGGHDSVCVTDPPHEWDPCHASWNNGLNDGFVAAYQNRYDMDSLDQVMGYLTRDHLPVTWALADAYTSCDKWHCSVMGPTWPNRMYWHTGTSQGISDNSLPAQGFNWQSIYHRLTTAGVEYSYYYGDVPVLAVIKDLPGVTDRIFRMEDFFHHCEMGTLAPVVYIDPAFSMNDDHPPKHTMIGQQLIASVYTALASSPQWKNIMFVLTYDEHGGFFDHVSPPTTADDFADQGFDQLGFRVPALVMGPYAKQGVVSTQFEHASCLKHLQNVFNLDPLYMRVDAATDLTDCIDMDRLMANDPADPAEIPEVVVNESDITDMCHDTMAMKRDPHDMIAMADKYPEIFAQYDRRAHVKDDLYLIGDFLEKHNAGRIVRGK
jgi:phospholipase C